MKQYLTFTEVEAAALAEGMTVEEFYFSEPAEAFENTDWAK